METDSSQVDYLRKRKHVDDQEPLAEGSKKMKTSSTVKVRKQGGKPKPKVQSSRNKNKK
jgi:hypothetical protein